ncbi:unnamed protein product [Heligmosomoides polygyrus]|uniref:Uncharacterized protein n=1 Tax=Heligmosomoides polygyrus TaxID=6339 RepID=A0A183F850_HELPZ|nr:unnamed protein product [Heligmosomoides polygyrus]
MEMVETRSSKGAAIVLRHVDVQSERIRIERNNQRKTIRSSLRLPATTYGYVWYNVAMSLLDAPATPGGSPPIVPFITGSFALNINRVVKRPGLTIGLVFRPPPSLRRLHTASPP